MLPEFIKTLLGLVATWVHEESIFACCSRRMEMVFSDEEEMYVCSCPREEDGLGVHVCIFCPILSLHTESTSKDIKMV